MNDLITKSKSLKRKGVHHDSIKKRMRISTNISVAFPEDMFDSDVEAHNTEDIHRNERTGSSIGSDINMEEDFVRAMNEQETTSKNQSNETNNGGSTDGEIILEEEEIISEDGNDDESNTSTTIETKLLHDYLGDCDGNDGNIAFIFQNYQSKKKPRS